MNDPVRSGVNRGGIQPPQAATAAATPPALWDPVIRIVHWGVALAVLANAMLDDGGSVLHVWVGWGVLALLVLRLVWGFVGPAEARFSAFPPSVGGALSHLRNLLRRRPGHFASHNPAGALMAYGLWAALAVIVLTGLVMTGTGPFGVMDAHAAAVAGNWDYLVQHPPLFPAPLREVAGQVHEIAADLLLLMAALHVGGVVVESRAMRLNLLHPMLFGRRPR